VVSEGIESASQSVQLQALGSDFGQGYYYSRPLTGSAMEPLLAARISEGDVGPAVETLAAPKALGV
jgi:EAL domain-containing protein (putative c-di-GMP-specific phosphodiesterase class I)